MYNLKVYFLDTSLTITNVLEEHGGLYQCVARSKVGMTHAELYLDVRKPGMSRVILYIYLGTVLRQKYIYRPPTKPREGIVFTGNCLSTGGVYLWSHVLSFGGEIQWDTFSKWAACILLECCLVLHMHTL